MKKIKRGLLLCGLALTLTSCNKKTDCTVGVCQLVQHEALDKATQGFKDGLEKIMKDNGKTITIDIQNASGDIPTCSTINNIFVSKKYDLIMANATPALQSAVSSTINIPILGTSITEYGVALGIDNFNGITNSNVSGTSDLAPLTEQADMFDELLPTKNRIGIFYCNNEANSKYQADTMKTLLEGKGKTVTIAKFSDSNDLSSVLNGLCNNVDAIYLPTDNTCASSADLIYSITKPRNIPIIAGESSLCAKCGIATLSISYYNIGLKTAEMAARILLEKADIKTMQIEYDEHPVKQYNKTIALEMGVSIPNTYEEIK